MDAFGYVVFGVAIAIATIATHYLLKFGRRQYEKQVLHYIETNTSFQNKLKDRFGWR